MEKLQSAIWSLGHTGGSTTNTAATLDYVRTRMFTEAAGDRDNVHNIVVVVTDGRSNNFNATVVSIEFIVLFIAQYGGVRWCCWYYDIVSKPLSFKLLIIKFVLILLQRVAEMSTAARVLSPF